MTVNDATEVMGTLSDWYAMSILPPIDSAKRYAQVAGEFCLC